MVAVKKAKKVVHENHKKILRITRIIYLNYMIFILYDLNKYVSKTLKKCFFRFISKNVRKHEVV